MPGNLVETISNTATSKFGNGSDGGRTHEFEVGSTAGEWGAGEMCVWGGGG